MLRFRISIVVFVMLLLVGCSSKTDDNQQSADPPFSLEPIAVEVHISPERQEVGKAVKIDAIVTQGEDKVLDADKVLFEIWRKNQEEEHEKIEGTHQGEGVYSLEKTFDKDGLYFVTSHVDARGLHTMPTHAFAIGQVSDEDLQEMKEQNEKHADDDHDHDHHDEGHDKQAH